MAPRWKKWLQSSQYFLVAKGVVNDTQKKALLIHTAGIEVQELYEMRTDPGTDTFEENTTTEYEKTVRTLNVYFVTKLNEPYERHVFTSMTQQDGETEEPLSVHKGVQKSPSKSSKQPNKKSGKGQCYRCGQEGHYGRNKCCPAHQAECSKCKMVDHYTAVCKTKTRGGAANSLGGRKREAEVNKYLEEAVVDDTDDDDDDEALGLFTAEDSEKKGHAPIQMSVMLDQKSCEMQLDTGATVSILPKTLYDQQFNQWPFPSTKVKLKA